MSTTSLSIDGPAGVLEARIDAAAGGDAAARVAVLCHPHPLYGGSMHDAVLDLAADVLLARGIDCLRFNFRGVGASAGTFDHGEGETFDLLAAVQWAQAERGARSIWLAGYSFGSNVVWRSLEALDRVERAWLIAPPIGRMSYPPYPALATPIDAFIGTSDDFVDHSAVDGWAQSAAPMVRVHRIERADHFFGGAASALSTALERAASTPH